MQDEHPTTVRDISNHATRLTFNAPLLRDIEIIRAVRETAGSILPKGRLAPLARHRFHLIDAAPVTASLSPATTMKPDWNMITFLHGAGRNETEKWLSKHASAIGKKETIDLQKLFFPEIVSETKDQTLAAGSRTAARVQEETMPARKRRSYSL